MQEKRSQLPHTGSAAALAPADLGAVARSLVTETQFITTNDGVRIAYDVFGKSGPAVVLIHGRRPSDNWGKAYRDATPAGSSTVDASV